MVSDPLRTADLLPDVVELDLNAIVDPLLPVGRAGVAGGQAALIRGGQNFFELSKSVDRRAAVRWPAMALLG